MRAPAIGQITTDPPKVQSLVLDAVHEGRCRPHYQKVVGRRRQKALEGEGTGLARIHLVVSASLVKNNRHAVVNRLDRSIGGHRNNGECRPALAGLRLPCFEEAGEEEQGWIHNGSRLALGPRHSWNPSAGTTQRRFSNASRKEAPGRRHRLTALVPGFEHEVRLRRRDVEPWRVIAEFAFRYGRAWPPTRSDRAAAGESTAHIICPWREARVSDFSKSSRRVIADSLPASARSLVRESYAQSRETSL
jgi:hypothetical protein